MSLLGPFFVNYVAAIGGTACWALFSYLLSLCGIKDNFFLFHFSKFYIPTLEQKRAFFLETTKAKGFNELPKGTNETCSVCLKKLKVASEEVSTLSCSK